jgi:large subunit ribosomal protein L16
LFEIGGGVPEDVAKDALRLAAYKLAIKTQIIQREVVGEES